MFLHVGHVVINVEKAGDEGGIKGDLPTEDVLQVVQLFLHAVDVQVKVLLAYLPGETECVKVRSSLRVPFTCEAQASSVPHSSQSSV